MHKKDTANVDRALFVTAPNWKLSQCPSVVAGRSSCGVSVRSSRSVDSSDCYCSVLHAAAPENLLEMQKVRPHLRYMDSKSIV